MNLDEKIIALRAKFPKIDIDIRIRDYLLTHNYEELEAKIDGHLEEDGEHPESFYTLRVGYECNNYCIHCFVEDKRYEGGDKTTEEIKATIDSITEKKTLVIVTGGEPTIRDDLVEILEYIKSKGFENSVQTNGLKFHDINYVNEVGPHIESVVLPVHSSDAQIFDAITRVDGSYEKTIQGFRNLVDTGVGVITQTVINQLNYKTILSTYDLIQEIFPGCGMTLTFPHPVGAANTSDIVPRFSEVREYLTPVFEKYGHLMHTHYIPKCLLYPYHGDVVVIDDTDDGNTLKPGIDYVHGEWKDTDYGSFGNASRIKSINCKQCVFDDTCVGIWAEYGGIYPAGLDLDLIPVKKNE
jgi:MoaA/NifB/PqqE/SkfB family radical SAM enzyme